MDAKRANSAVGWFSVRPCTLNPTYGLRSMVSNFLRIKSLYGHTELPYSRRMANNTLRLEMRLDQATAAALDDLRRHAPDLPSRSELIRRLIHAAHASAGTSHATTAASPVTHALANGAKEPAS
jgi:hypothetical protein